MDTLITIYQLDYLEDGGILWHPLELLGEHLYALGLVLELLLPGLVGNLDAIYI